MIRQLVQIQKRIVPDLIEEMQTRYDILHYVRLMQPIGRRTLAPSLGLTERVLRREVLERETRSTGRRHRTG